MILGSLFPVKIDPVAIQKLFETFVVALGDSYEDISQTALTNLRLSLFREHLNSLLHKPYQADSLLEMIKCCKPRRVELGSAYLVAQYVLKDESSDFMHFFSKLISDLRENVRVDSAKGLVAAVEASPIL